MLKLATSVLAAIVLLGSGGAAISSDPSLSDIVAALEKRSRSLDSGRIEWTVRVVHAAGSSTDPGGPAFPAEDTETSCKSVLAWDGRRMSYRYKGETPAIDRSKYVPLTYANVLDGSGKGRSVRINESIEYPMGTVSKANDLEDAEGIELTPILLWLRPTAKLCFGINADYKSLPDRQKVEGRDCLVFARERGAVVDLLFVDAEHDFSIVRYEVQQNKKAVVRIDVLYANDAKAGWVPASWQSLWIAKDGQVLFLHKGTVSTYQVNVKPEAKLFELEFPPGSWVHDNIDGKQYVLQLDGTKRVVTPEDRKRRKKYQDFLKPD